MQQDLEKQILELTKQLGASRMRYDALRNEYASAWNPDKPGIDYEFAEQLGKMAKEIDKHNQLFNQLCRKYAMLFNCTNDSKQ